MAFGKWATAVSTTKAAAGAAVALAVEAVLICESIKMEDLENPRQVQHRPKARFDKCVALLLEEKAVFTRGCLYWRSK